MVTFATLSKENKWKELKWYVVGLIITNALLAWGGFYTPLIR